MGGRTTASLMLNALELRTPRSAAGLSGFSRSSGLKVWPEWSVVGETVESVVRTCETGGSAKWENTKSICDESQLYAANPIMTA